MLWLFCAALCWSAFAQDGRKSNEVFVDSAGSAVFSMPIALPQGAGDVSAELALEHRSQRGNGVLGLGWAVTGVSSVTRCAKVPAEEGARWGIANNASDVFCLDGKKLRAFSGTYGADGAEYRLALDNYARIRSQGSVGGGPRSFTLEAKDGRIYEFGTADASRLEHPSKGAIRVWMLDRIKDRFGNAIQYTYDKNATLGEQRLVRIAYSNGVVHFRYEGRPSDDLIVAYADGVQYGSTHSRLSAIDVMHRPMVSGAVQERLVQTIGFAYIQSPSSRRSLLSRVTRCAPDGQCLPELVLTYRTGTPGQFVHAGAHPGAGGKGPFAVADFAGSGRQTIHSFVRSNTLNDSFVWDIDGDQKSDRVYIQGPPNAKVPQVFYEKTQYGNGQESSRVLPSFGLTGYLCFADLDGDGVSEPLEVTHRTLGGGRVHHALKEHRTGSAFDFGDQMPVACKSLDLDGDGRAELLITSATDIPTLLSYNGSALVRQPISVSATHPKTTLGDFNGDGRTDWITGAASVVLSQGDATNGSPSWTSTGKIVCMGDFNGDGRTDIFTDAMAPNLVLSTGTGSHRVAHSLYPMNWFAGCGDWNGDGLTDVAVNQAYWINALPLDVDRLIDIRSDGGLVQKLSYGTITHDSIYTKGSGAVHPMVDLQIPLIVVTGLERGTADAGFDATTYRYHALRANLRSSGTLGFERVVERRALTGVSVATHYHQAYPLTGLRSRMHTYVGSDAAPQTLEDQRYTYLQRGVGVPSATALSAQVHLSKTETTQFDLAQPGARVGSVTEVSEGFDSYGFPARVTTEHKDANAQASSRSVSEYVYQHDAAPWLIGLMARATTTRTNLRASDMLVPATVSYTCPPEHTLTGTDCVKLVTTPSVTAATPVYSCPSGWALSGTACTANHAVAGSPYCAVPGTTLVDSNTRCRGFGTASLCSLQAATVGVSLIHQEMVNDAVTRCDYSVSYTCPAGTALSGSQCLRPMSQAASMALTCPAGSTLNGSQCHGFLTTPQTVAAQPVYACAAGSALQGQHCLSP
ncbi:SpvB/TcaC N-terminal domain-containing protein [Hydrogenophaga sp. BPS33]|uniref:SpvB/TcaC N-terminal domain-containing protein n=1 Tax=Hydrogenophaga sp. BPS33 TaxID=2651974 RepID=UPI00135BB1CF|nr:SpvB/TcaC N-terminal domain-containing protein [Hydrogenophaga sp. BPS33]